MLSCNCKQRDRSTASKPKKIQEIALLGVLALVIGGVYTALLGRDIVSIKR